MWMYEKRLQFPVNIAKPDPRMAKLVVTQYGGPDGELAASLRYLNQRYTMPDEKGRMLLTDIGTEELAHVEIVCAMVSQLMEGASLEEIKAAGMDTHYATRGMDLYPTDSLGNAFTVKYFGAVGDPLADLMEDMAAEEKARAVYENLIDLATDPAVIAPLLWLREREIVHFQMFKELRDYYKDVLKL